MPGRRLDIDSIGESYEVFAESVLGRIASLTRIGTKQDFGTDIYCQPRNAAGARTEAVTELCLLQVKGGAATLEYGGLDRNRNWNGHEFEWLKGLWAPLYLVTVDAEYHRADLFSLWPIWWVFWQCGTPFKVVFSWGEPTDEEYEYSNPTKELTPLGAGYGDGHTWTIDLGPPALSLTHTDLNDASFRDACVEIFRYWIRVDRQTVARFHAGISLIEAIFKWRTNQSPTAQIELLAMDNRPGMNLDWLGRAVAGPLLALGAHLQHQGNSDAFRLIPMLEWLESNRYGTLITGQLLEKLSRAHREGVSPANYL